MIRRENVDALDLTPGTPIEILWVDARYLSGWHDRPEILQWERDFNEHRSTGLFVYVNDENLLHCETYTQPGWEHRAIAGINAIPLTAIRGIWRLERLTDILEPRLTEGTMQPDQARELVGAPPVHGTPWHPNERLIEPDDELIRIAELALEWRRRDLHREHLYQRSDVAREQLVADTRFVSNADQAMRVALDKRLGVAQR